MHLMLSSFSWYSLSILRSLVLISAKSVSFLKHILPNYGFGYRWEFKKRVNVRLDLGFGKHQTGFIFNINEAF